MSQKPIEHIVLSSGEETESANETFAFAHKRKPSSFFIDLTEDMSKSKRARQESNVEDENSMQNDVQFVKFVPPPAPSEVSSVIIEQAKTFHPSDVTTVSQPIFCSPPSIV